MTAFVISNAGGNFNSAASYVAGSGTPVAGDTITATGTSGNLTVTATAACASIDFTSYVGQFTINAGINLTLTANLTLVSGMSIGAAAGVVNFTGTSTLTSAGKSLPWLLNWSGAAKTYTMADSWTTTGAVTVSGTTTINGNTVHCKGSFACTSGTVGGTTIFSLEGTSWAASGGTCNLSVQLASTGTLTMAGTIQWGTGSITYVSGAVSGGSSTLVLNGSCTLSLGASAHLNNLTVFAAALTTTLAADLFVDAAFVLPNGNWTLTGAFTLTAKTITSAVISAARTWTINIATTVVFTGSVTLAGIVGGHAKFVSSSGGTKAVLTFNTRGFGQSIYLVDATDIDSSKGNPVYSIAGVIGGAANWNTSLVVPTAYPRNRIVNVGGSI